ncbi:hypothetical protein [Nocardia sp. NPDC057353]|uniref:hypothetical protein n=1 Tax=Nocardia sp. NPDC057353 TaxID=3346104 RepID=UPI003643F95D
MIRRQFAATVIVVAPALAGFGFPGYAAAIGTVGLAQLTAFVVSVTVIYEITAMGYEDQQAAYR